MKGTHCCEDIKLNQVAVITSTSEEYETVKRVFDQEEGKGSPVIALCGEENGSAASLYADLLQQYPDLKSVILCGTAEGIACEVGDVVISKGVLGYDHAREKEKLVKIHCSDELANAVIRTFQDEYSGSSKWRTGLSGYPKLHYADIATSDLIANTKGGATPWMGRYNIKAIETESSGIIDTMEESEVPFLVICGISGIADEDGIRGQIRQTLKRAWNKSSETEKNHAMLNAAVYARSVVACAGGM